MIFNWLTDNNVLQFKVSRSKGRNVIPITGTIITSFIFLLLSSPQAIAIDYVKELLDPTDRVERPPEVPIGYDFDDVIFNREYFYSTTQGVIQYRNTGSGLWNSLDLNLKNAPSGEQPLREVPEEDSWENEVAPGTVGAKTSSQPPSDVRQQITKPGNKEKTREDVLRELQRDVDSGR